MNDFIKNKPLIFSLILEHLYLFLPCTEHYFKLVGELTQNQFLHSYAQQSLYTGGIGRFMGGYGESALVKKLSNFSR